MLLRHLAQRCLLCMEPSGCDIMNKTLSISEWHRMAMEGVAPPMRILLNGYSMEPLVRRNIDYVTIVPLKDNISVGDIVLFSDKNTERFVVHRVWEVKSEKVLTWGDNCHGPDGWFPLDAIWGKVVLIEHGKRVIHPNPKKGLWWARFWHKVRPGYYSAWRIKETITRRIKKLKV